MGEERHREPAPPSYIERARELLPIGQMAPERYVALHAHQWAAASIFTYRYPDPEVDEFMRRVNVLLREHEQWEDLRRKWLTTEEHQQVLDAERQARDYWSRPD